MSGTEATAADREALATEVDRHGVTGAPRSTHSSCADHIACRCGWMCQEEGWHVDDHPDTYNLHVADAIFASDCLADRDRDRATAARALREAADAIVNGDIDHEDLRCAGISSVAPRGWSEASVIDAHDSGSVWADQLRARAERIEAPR